MNPSQLPSSCPSTFPFSDNRPKRDQNGRESVQIQSALGLFFFPFYPLASAPLFACFSSQSNLFASPRTPPPARGEMWDGIVSNHVLPSNGWQFSGFFRWTRRGVCKGFHRVFEKSRVGTREVSALFDLVKFESFYLLVKSVFWGGG